MIASKSILITGGTGTFGNAFVQYALAELELKRLIIFSRDEAKQAAMATRYCANEASPLRFFLGDVRDLQRLRRAFEGVDYVIHAAALKHVASGEYNPTEVIKTNVDGAANVIEAALDTGVRRAVALSTDKACAPANLYGATKLVSEKLFRAANAYTGTSFVAVRYGNVAGSRGSVIPIWRELTAVTVTDPEATRFWMTPRQAVDLVMWALVGGHSGELLVPWLPAYRLGDLAEAMHRPIAKVIGLQRGEKLHEMMIGPDELAEFSVRTPYREGTKYWASPAVPHHYTRTAPVSSETTRRMTIEHLREEIARLGLTP